MNKIAFSGILMMLLGRLVSAELPYLRAERASAVYKVGEIINFRVTGPVSGATYTVCDGVKTSAPAPLADKPVAVKAEKPGFILVTVNCGKKQDGKPAVTYAGAAVEPEKIVPGTPDPADFDEFWRKELTELRSKPMQTKETPVPAKCLPEGLAAYSVTITRGDVTATGFVTFPAGADRRSLPGLLTFLGASKVNAELAGTFCAANGLLVFNLNFHGLENYPVPLADFRKTPEFLAAKRKVAGYRHKFADDPHKYAMRKIFLRTVLAADYLMQKKEFNGKDLVSYGGSLGGCQALVCAALVPQVTACVSQATAMCDHYGAKAGHLPGWPELLRNVPKAEKSAACFDVVNFARRVKCPVYMAVGFIDTTCPPASTYAAYNAIKSPKKMMHTVTSGHGGKCLDPKDTGVFQCWRREILRELTGNGKIQGR